ncbi:hypothetical protein VNI00_002459 [Paramarasmius palmivorus]|uniref:Arrestin C-terminal-like domain-containing protein n=1 Tax=Paramarasmius palmivorus TaxID=297713 RepID=A0AAW0DYM9_9AGAR
MPKSPSYNSGRRPHHRRSTSIPVSMDPDLEDVPEVMTTPHASPHSSPNPDATPSNAPEPPPYSYDLPNTRNEPGAQRETEPARVALTRPPSRDDIHSRHGGASVSAPPTADSEDNRGRERKKRRFSLSSVFHAILGKGRSKSKSKSRISLASQDGRNDGLNPTSHREEPSTGRRERIRDAGMSVKSGVSGDSGETVTANRTKRERSIVEVGSTTSSQTGRSRLSFGMISDMLPDAAKDKTKDVVEGVGWREFKRGKCFTNRAFSSNITTTHPVLVVSSPSPSMSCPSADEDLIVVERSWEDQLQYMISISGRSFHVGGRIPISFSLVPLRGIKIHRVGVTLEEKIEYCTNFKRVARSDPVVAHQLLQLRQTNQDTAGGDHILPLPEATLQALQDSPLITVLNKNIIDQEHVGIFAGAGPWSWDVEVEVPGTCRTLRASCKNRRSNMKVEHLLKCVLRVERCPDEESMPGREPEGGSNTKKKRKLFDIVVQTPVMILNCRCSPELLALPSYEAHFPEPGLSLPCPCVERRLSEWGKRASASSRNRASIEHSKRSGMILGDRASEKRSSTLSSITSSSIDHVKRLSSTSNSSAEATKDAALQQTMAALLRNEGSSLVPDTIASRNSQFERLVSGVESADGERVPGYES